MRNVKSVKFEILPLSIRADVTYVASKLFWLWEVFPETSEVFFLTSAGWCDEGGNPCGPIYSSMLNHYMGQVYSDLNRTKH